MFFHYPPNLTRVFVILALGLVAACSSTRNKTEVVKAENASAKRAVGLESETEKAALAMDQNIVSTINFEPGRRALSPEATAEINRAILEAKQRGEVDEVSIAVWSDMKYPANKDSKLPKQQIDIAKERGDNIEKYIDQLEPKADVSVHNMAERPGAFSNFLKTQDATMKNRLSALGVANAENPEAQTSSALIFIKLK